MEIDIYGIGQLTLSFGLDHQFEIEGNVKASLDCGNLGFLDVEVDVFDAESHDIQITADADDWARALSDRMDAAELRVFLDYVAETFLPKT